MARRPQVKWYSKKAKKVALEAAMKALMTGGEAIVTDAINEAPVETGTLRRSGTVTKGGLPSDSEQIYQDSKRKTEGGQAKHHKKAFKDEELGKEQAVYVSFNTPYALVQHEDLYYNRKTKKLESRKLVHPKGGGPKYLEGPFNRLKGKVAKRVERQVKKALRETE